MVTVVLTKDAHLCASQPFAFKKKKEQKGCNKCSQYACAGDFSPHLHLTEHLNTNTSHKHLIFCL